MPAKNHLNSQQVEKLQRELKDEDNGDTRERILILLLLNDGKTQAEIAKFLGCSVNKVCYWCVHGDPDNLESLRDERMKGNHRKATEKYIEILLETVDKEPQEFGYEFGRWTGERLATYLEKITEIKLSGSQVRRILERKKYVFIWAKYSLESKKNGSTAPFMINSAESLAQSGFLANQKQISVRSRLGKTLMYFKFALDIRGAVEPSFIPPICSNTVQLTLFMLRRSP